MMKQRAIINDRNNMTRISSPRFGGVSYEGQNNFCTLHWMIVIILFFILLFKYIVQEKIE